jgi:hypothetical protein
MEFIPVFHLPSSLSCHDHVRQLTISSQWAEAVRTSVTSVTSTQSYPLSKWHDVVRLWGEANGWQGAPTMAQRSTIADAVQASPSFINRVVARVLGTGTMGPLPRGGAHNVKITDDVGAFIWALWEQDVQMDDFEYQSALATIGVHVDKSTISRYMNTVLQLPVKKPYEVRMGKYTDDNVQYMWEYFALVRDVDPLRLRFFDQMGLDSRNTGRKRCRWLKGVPAFVGMANPRGTHITVSGLTCIRPEQPALAYEAVENGHTAEHHREWMLEMAADYILERGDVTISDNWSGHVGGECDCL